MPPTSATTYQYCTSDDVTVLLSSDGVTGRVDDDASGTASAGETAYLTRAIQWATARCNLYLLGSHAAADLAQSWIVNQYASIIAAYFVSARRGNPAAASLATMFDEVMTDLKAIRSGELTLPDTADRDSAFPAWSNLSFDSRYSLKKLRVEQGISSQKGDRSGQIIDHSAAVISPHET